MTLPKVFRKELVADFSRKAARGSRGTRTQQDLTACFAGALADVAAVRVDERSERRLRIFTFVDGDGREHVDTHYADSDEPDRVTLLVAR